MFYCNFELLQQAFKNSYILISKQDNYKLAARRHREFVNWAILLNRTINNFGFRVSDESSCGGDDAYYHGLLQPFEDGDGNGNVGGDTVALDFNFNESLLRFYCPLMMSDSIEVLYQYLYDKNGMMLSLCPVNNGGVHKYFDCVWLSYFESETQKLFMHNAKYIMKESLLRINDMIDTCNYNNYGYYMNGISILNAIINNEILLFDTNKNMFNALGKMMSHRLRPISYNKDDKEDAYVDAIFARFCQLQTGIITVDMNKLLSLSHKNKDANAFLRNYLISQTQTEDIFVLKCHNFVELFPNTPSIEITNCCLNSIMFELICQSLKLQEYKIDLESIEFTNINEELSELTIDGIITKYSDKMDEVGWSLSKTEFAEIKIEKLKFILLSPKTKLSVSIFNSAFYYGNATKTNEQLPDGTIDGEVKTSYGIYQVKIVNDDKTWMVEKRYSDFLQIHKFCTKKRQNIKHPIAMSKIKFPSKTIFAKSDAVEVMEERKDKFEKYLQYLLIQSYKHESKIYLKHLSHFLTPSLFDEEDNYRNDSD